MPSYYPPQLGRRGPLPDGGGRNAVKKALYAELTYSGTSDCMQALYLGVTRHIFECNRTCQYHGGR
ncbi:MAG: hypothetical protein ACLT8E_02555 [Akkermansia sp.]